MLISIRIVASLMIVSLTTISIPAQSIPNLINYQGRLTDQTGGALPSGSYSIEFRLWNSPASTNGLVWGQRQTVVLLDNGVFNVILGAPGGTAISGASVNDLTYAFYESNRYLGLTVVVSNGFTIPLPSEILPRQQLLTVPYSIKSADGNPIGTVMPYAGQSTPLGWLLCDGSYVATNSYPHLWNIIGNSFGAGIPGLFKLPDLRGRVPMGAGAGAGLSNRVLGQSLGEESHLLTKFEMPSHSHPINYTGRIIGQYPPVRLQNVYGFQGGGLYDNTGYIPLDIGSTGGDQPHNIMQPSVILNYIIKY
jgi:microcystin-dependent protein